MDSAFQRGLLLYNQNRYAMAGEEFRKALAANLNNARAKAMLALCLTYDGKQREGIIEARAAVAIDPQRAFSYYVLACTILGPAKVVRPFMGMAFSYRRSLRKAKVPAMEAIRLEPDNADYMALMSAIEIDLRYPRKALSWANKGLAIDPEHVRCANLRANALAKIGNLREARRTLNRALAADPENAGTHSTTGWTLLKAGQNEQAAEHFRESLRINPNSVNAQRGLSAASKGKQIAGGTIVALFIMQVVRAFSSQQQTDDRGLIVAILGIAALCSIIFYRKKRRR